MAESKWAKRTDGELLGSFVTLVLKERWLNLKGFWLNLNELTEPMVLLPFAAWFFCSSCVF
jgi:hypothetical protein